MRSNVPPHPTPARIHHLMKKWCPLRGPPRLDRRRWVARERPFLHAETALAARASHPVGSRSPF
eukprot:7517367-Pyramimonas_sp.AAC.1